MSTYYVRKTGDDGNTGTDPDTDAVLTLAACYALMSDDDTMNIGEGTWTENLDNATSPISIVVQGAGMFKTTMVGDILSGYPARSKNFTMKDMKTVFQDVEKTLYEYVWYKESDCFLKLDSVFIDWNSAGTVNDTIFYGGVNGGSTWTNCIMANWVETQSYSVCNAEISIDHCTFYNMANGGGNQWRIDSGGLLQFTNSILQLVGNPVDTAADNASTINVLYCVVSHNWTTGEIDDLTGSLVNTDPLMVDPANGDFSLQENSPALGLGVIL